MTALNAKILTEKSKTLGDMFFDDKLIVFSLKDNKTKNWAIKAYDIEKAELTTLLDEGLFSNFHVYGGGAFLFKKGCLYYCKDEDQNLYRKELESNTEKKVLSLHATSFLGDYDSFEDDVFCLERELLEDGETHNLLYIDTKNGESKRIQSHADFYSSPKISNCGRYLAWLEWQNPNMPWQQCHLFCALWDRQSKTLKEKKIITNSAASFQPSWHSDRFLYFTNDKDGYWNLYRYSIDDSRYEKLFSEPIDCGRPHWTYGSCVYDFISQDEILFSFVRDGLL